MLKMGNKGDFSSESNRTLNFVKEKFNQVQASLQFSRTIDNQVLKTIAITSSMKEEGKSYCVENLGKSFANKNKRTLMVDADMHKAKLSKKFDVFSQSGLSDLLISKKNPIEYVVETNFSNLFILPTGVLPPNPIDLINSDRMREIIYLLENKFDMVIFDTPPVQLLSDARIIGSMCNGVIVVVKIGQSKNKELESTLHLLKQANSYIIGAILNGKKYKRNEMNNYTYY